MKRTKFAISLMGNILRSVVLETPMIAINNIAIPALALGFGVAFNLLRLGLTVCPVMVPMMFPFAAGKTMEKAMDFIWPELTDEQFRKSLESYISEYTNVMWGPGDDINNNLNKSHFNGLNKLYAAFGKLTGLQPNGLEYLDTSTSSLFLSSLFNPLRTLRKCYAPLLFNSYARLILNTIDRIVEDISDNQNTSAPPYSDKEPAPKAAFDGQEGQTSKPREKRQNNSHTSFLEDDISITISPLRDTREKQPLGINKQDGSDNHTFPVGKNKDRPK